MGRGKGCCVGLQPHAAWCRCTRHIQLHVSGRGEGKEKRLDHYSALGFPGKIAEDLKGAIDEVKAALKIIALCCFGYNLSLVHYSIRDSSALQ